MTTNMEVAVMYDTLLALCIDVFGMPPEIATATVEFLKRHDKVFIDAIPAEDAIALILDRDACLGALWDLLEDSRRFNPCNPPVRFEVVLDEPTLGPFVLMTYHPEDPHPDFYKQCTEGWIILPKDL